MISTVTAGIVWSVSYKMSLQMSFWKTFLEGTFPKESAVNINNYRSSKNKLTNAWYTPQSARMKTRYYMFRPV